MSLSLRNALIVALLLVPVSALAEGTTQVETNQNLQSDTAIKVDIIHHATESITWTGTGTATIKNPSGTTVATLLTTQSYSPVVDGTFSVTLSNAQTAWDITVSGTAAGRGRVHSSLWSYNTGSFAQNVASAASYYALVPGGAAGKTGVVELRLDGLSGNQYTIGANRTGVDGANAGRSVLQANNNFTPSFEMYLLPPEISTYDPVTPQIPSFSFTAGAQNCNLIVPGTTTGTFKFDTNVDGTYNLVCDLDRNGVYNRVAATDLLIVGTAVPGTNSVPWDGKNNAGTNVGANDYNCKVFVNTGELHFVGADIETSYRGLRLFGVDNTLTRTGLAMFWNDSAIPGTDVNLPAPTSVPGLPTSGADGIPSGLYADAASANVNAHSWGDFSGSGKGNISLIDTFSSLISTASTVASLTAVAAATDTDSDGLNDYLESCTLGTNRLSNDSDGDTIHDGVEAPGGVAVNTDGTGGIDALDTDSDDDGVLDGVDTNRTNSSICQDQDGDTCDDCAIVHTGGGSTTNDGLDTDGDTACNLGDPDDDGDGVADNADSDPLDANKCTDLDHDGCDDCAIVHTGAGSVANDGLDSDGDGLCNVNDTDDDGDGVADNVDVAPLDSSRCQDADSDGCDDCTNFHILGGSTAADGLDTDGDGLCNLTDTDDDGDGIPDNVDIDSLDASRCRDTDNDGCDDCAVVHVGGGNASNDGLDTDGDGLCNVNDGDDDGDGIADNLDVDPLDASKCRDTDNDGCDDCTVVHTGGGNASNDGLDTDGDGVCNVSDSDDDGDGVADNLDLDPLDPSKCRDTDSDGCDDCVIVHVGGGSASNDGADADHDGICDVNDHDADNDGVIDLNDVAPHDPNRCRDTDNDTCDDCARVHTNGGSASNDGTDSDGDGQCDAGDSDDDNDGVLDASDRAPLDPHSCTDSDHDKCDDCSVTGGDGSGGDPHNDGADANGDGICDLGGHDSDGDGLPDVTDLDIDGDGIPNSLEGDGDRDGDGVPDASDLDSDNDGIPDVVEAGGKDSDGDGKLDDQHDANKDGLDDAVAAKPLPRPDTDKDGIIDVLDLDSDGDGIADVVEAGGGKYDHDGDGRIDHSADENENGWDDAVDGDRTLTSAGTLLPVPDTDKDGTPDYLDTDSDGDGLDDAIEGDDFDSDGVADTKPTGDVNHDGIDDAYVGLEPAPDHDQDGKPDFQDVDDDGDGRSTADERKDGTDTDKDGTPDYLDTDSDGDGVSDASENQDGGDVDKDGVPDYRQPKVFPADTDKDGIPDYIEDSAGPDTDTDSDGTPDAKDDDDDGDGILTKDERPDAKDIDTDGDGVPDYLDADDDGDGIPTKDELSNDGKPIDTDGDGVPNHLDADDDDDGVPTKDELGKDGQPIDTDKDGLPDHLDKDDDGDGVPTKDELGKDGQPIDTDKDGTPNYLDKDDDGDGIPTRTEYTPKGGKQNDVDHDGIPNYLDKDSDGDGVSDKVEGTTDVDQNGVPDFREAPHLGFAGGAGCSIQGPPSFGGLAFFLLIAIGVIMRRRRIGA